MVNIEILVGIIAIAVIGAVFIPLAFDPPITSLGGGNVTIIETMPIGIQHLFGHWDTVRTFIPIGTTFTDVFVPLGSQGQPILINTTEFTEIRLVVQMEQITLGAPSITFLEKKDKRFNDCTTCTFEFENNGGGASRILLVTVDQSSDGFPTNVTYAGQQLILARSDFFVNGTISNPIESSIWYIVNPSLGKNDVVTFFNSTQNPSAIILAISYSGVELPSPINAVGGSFGESSSPSAQITTTTDNAFTVHTVTAGIQVVQLSLSERLARPNATDINNGWTITGAATHHEAVDEVVPNDDTDFIESDIDDERVRVQLSPLVDPDSDKDHILRLTAIAINGTGSDEILDVELYQGVVLKGTEFKTVKRDEWKQLEFKFGNPSITNYADLHIEIASNMNGTAGEIIRVTQMEFETPLKETNVLLKKNADTGKERLKQKLDDLAGSGLQLILGGVGDQAEPTFGTFTRGWDIIDEKNNDDPFIANFTMTIIALEPLAGGAFGNQTIRLVDQNGVDVIALIENLMTGNNDSGFVAIPTILNDTSKFYKLQLKSSEIIDQITFLQGLVYLR